MTVTSAHPSLHARTSPAKAAVILAETGETLSFAELEARSNQAAHMFRRHGTQRGDGIVVLMGNSIRYFEPVWAAQRSGLYLTTLPTRLTLEEAAFIVADSGAKILVASSELRELALALAERLQPLRLFIVNIDGLSDIPLAQDYDAALAQEPATPVTDESAGADMLYSSGTTGRPKGVKMPLTEQRIDTPGPLATIAADFYGVDAQTIYLSPAPLYHAAPLRWTMTVQALGGTVVVMRRFDPELALEAIQQHRATASQWVPTHFVRMLKLTAARRAAFDVSSMRLALHAAAPCPVMVKRAMLEWWGPVLYEYYGGTENFGFTTIGPEDWLRKPGSVGLPLSCEVRICDEHGEPLPPGVSGDVYFKSDVPLPEYHGDPDKTRASRNRHGWATYGDIGHVDADGYLFLTDRRSFMIISGGVNIYPQEIENALIAHPQVRDVAVIGVPDPEMGERVVAVIEPECWQEAGDALAADIASFARARLSAVKLPRQIDFMRELPRQPTGKLFKRLLLERYAGSST